jgi:quinol monooxygenase YgiN
VSTVTVRMKVKPEAHDMFLRILEEVTAAVKENEPDCFVYATWKTSAPFEYLMVESYRSAAGREFHNATHAAVAPEFMDCLVEPPEVEVLGDVLFGTASPF